MTVYIDDAFVHADWGKWSGGGHLMADSDEELHAFAQRLGLKRAWAQLRPTRPWMNHYDCVRSKRDLAIKLGATPEDAAGFASRLRERREAVGSASVGAGVEPTSETPSRGRSET